MGGLLLMWSLSLSSKGARMRWGRKDGRKGDFGRGDGFCSMMAGRLGGIFCGELGTVI